MCRNFNIVLNPLDIKRFFFKKNENGEYISREKEEILDDILTRKNYAFFVTEDCSKKNTKAGYDAAGIAVNYFTLDNIIEKIVEDKKEYNEENMQILIEEMMSTLVPNIQKEFRVSRDGGDLLKTWNRLYDKLNVEDNHFITNVLTHIRQASQGDMYSEVNSHPHSDIILKSEINIYTTLKDSQFEKYSKRKSWNKESLFSTSHNGDINDSTRYKNFLRNEGFEFFSNADSCIIPALKRYIFEHIKEDELLGGLTKLAYTDVDLNSEKVIVDNEGYAVKKHYFIGLEYKNKELLIKKNDTEVFFFYESSEIKRFKQRGFLIDEKISKVEHKISSILNTAYKMRKNGAKLATTVSAIVSRILEYSCNENKFVFQTSTLLGKTKFGYIGGGTYILARGGSREGGEAGGEAVFYIPKEYDKKNYGLVSIMTGSEENAFKEVVELLDINEYKKGNYEVSKPKELEISHLKNIKAKGFIKEGYLPVFDLNPGEIMEVTANGDINVYDIYSGIKYTLLNDKECVYGTNKRVDLNKDIQIDGIKIKQYKKERLAPLKIFNVEYFDLEDNKIECPFNKYGEEIIVIQPNALKENSKKLFTENENGDIVIRECEDGIGLLMNTDSIEARDLRIKNLKYKITAAAGTSDLICQIAENISRKLGLNSLATKNLEGFTGSDTFPNYIDSNTLIVANSNSGGTSDTIKMVTELTSLQTVLDRAEKESKRKDITSRDAGGTLALIEKIRKELYKGLKIEDLPEESLKFLREWMPWVYSITNIEASPLGNIGRGIDKSIFRPAGAGITNLPEEECVGSTFAAMASLQWQIALDTYLGEVRGDISTEYARSIYKELYKLPETVEKIVGNEDLILDIEKFSDSLIGGNYDFIYTGYVQGVPEEQAHKGAEMIQETFIGFQFFMFQHGKYAHVKRQSRHTIGSVIGHNSPPPSWEFFNTRSLKSPKEISPRAGTLFMVCHDSNVNELKNRRDYPVDYLFPYPEDSIVLYPFQANIIGHLVSYLWGKKKKEIGDLIFNWNKEFVEVLCSIDKNAVEIDEDKRKIVAENAKNILNEFHYIIENKQYFDNIGVRRKDFLIHTLYLLASDVEVSFERNYKTPGILNSDKYSTKIYKSYKIDKKIDNKEYLSILKDISLELSDNIQAKRLADHFLTDDKGMVANKKYSFIKSNGMEISMYEYDYWCQYEGLGTMFSIDPIHPPKIAKAKKGWL